GKLSELREQLAVVAQAHDEAQSYARQLNSDVRQTLRLAKGLARIDAQAGQAIEKRNNPTATTEKRPSSRRSRSRRNNDSEPTPDLREQRPRCERRAQLAPGPPFAAGAGGPTEPAQAPLHPASRRSSPPAANGGDSPPRARDGG